jgi:hypothetical protein
VCADSPGMSLQLGDAALYAAPTDVAGLADAVRTVRADVATRERLVRAGHELAASLTPAGYVSRVIEELDAFEAIRDTWPLG